MKDVTICVKGITNRQGVKEFYLSRNLALAKKLLEKGLNAYAWDELMPNEEVGRRGYAGSTLKRLWSSTASLSR